MSTKYVRCVVVEVPAQSDAEALPGIAKDLLPWADPYITRLLTRQRLQAALDDSLRFVQHEKLRRNDPPYDPCDAATAWRTLGRARLPR